MSGKISELEIDSEDFAVYTADYGDKIVELHLDYFGRKTIREVLVFTKEETILGDIAGNKIMFLNSGKHMDFREEQDRTALKIKTSEILQEKSCPTILSQQSTFF